MTDTRYRDAEWLEEQYHENGLSQREIGDKCGVGKSAVYRWMDKHDIEASQGRVGVGVYHKDGYQVWQEWNGAPVDVRVHRLLAVAEYGFDAVCDMHIHHKNGIRWDNRPDNIEVLTPSEHSTHHNHDEYDNGDTRYRDADWLYEQYHDNRLSQREVADKCGVSHETVRRWMDKHGIETRDSGGQHTDQQTEQAQIVAYQD